jgi:putative thioredoxin
MAESKYILDATPENFAELVMGNSMRGPVMVNYWSAKAGPCLKLWPQLEKLVNEYSGRFLLVNFNTDKFLEFSRSELGITSVPTVKMYQQQQIVDTIYGVESERSFQDMINRHLPRASDPLVVDAVKQYQQMNVDEAFAQLKKLQQTDFDNPRIPLTLIKLMFKEKRLTEMFEYIKTLPRALRENDEVINLIAYAEFTIAAEKAPEKEVLIDKLVIDSEQVDTHYQLGSVYLVEDSLQAAMDEMLEVIRIDRAYKDDIGTKGMVAILNMIASDADLVRSYRKKMIDLIS